MLRFLTAGESHGKALTAILEGMVANMALNEDDINTELLRRQGGIGRSERMKIEKDSAQILSGVRKGHTIGSPICILIENADSSDRAALLTRPRPGHADLAGSIKYNQKDLRNILERASARETAARVAAGAIARKLLSEFKIKIESDVIALGGLLKQNEWKDLVEKARKEGDSLGGIFEVRITGLPAGLGSHVQWDRKLDGLLAQSIMSIQAIKGVDIGMGFGVANRFGSEVHDEIMIKNGKIFHSSNNAGGIEGGMSNGEPVILRAAMKPIATLKKPLRSVDLATKKSCEAHFERSDVCAVHSAAVIAENAAAMVIAGVFLEKFGGDSLEETKAHFASFL
ncbi:MAG: chorismate synthase [Candidatus Saganbacteria bacterium]|nr:chorismate synthase [Candidatus Saganbacteria bacterium]